MQEHTSLICEQEHTSITLHSTEQITMVLDMRLFPSKHLLSCMVHLWVLLYSCHSLIFKQFKSCSILPSYHGRWSGFYKYYYSRFKLTTVEIFEQTPVNQQRFWRFRNDEIGYCFPLASGASPIIANKQSCKAQSRTLIPIVGVSAACQICKQSHT